MKIRSPHEGRGTFRHTLNPVGRTSNNLRANHHTTKSHPHPGRVAPQKREFSRIYRSAMFGGVTPARRACTTIATATVMTAHTAHAGGSTR